MTDIKQKARELLSRAETHGTSVVISLDDMRAIESALQQREYAVSMLVEKWRKQAETHGARTFTGNDHALFANELEAALKGGEA